MRIRVAVSVAAGLAAFALVLWLRLGGRSNFSDFDHLWVSARAMFSGLDPYVVVPRLGYKRPLYYPMPAVLVVAPFALLPQAFGHAAFVAVGVAAFAFALSAFGWWPLLTLLSFGAINAMELGQWSLIAASIGALPWLGWLAIVKPTTAGAIAVANLPGSIRGRAAAVNVIVGSALVVVSFLVLPTWFTEWRSAIGSADHFAAPITQPLGMVLGLALFRWRRPEARLLVCLACAPQSMALYEVAPLGLIVRSRLEAVIFVAGCLVARVAMVPTGEAPLRTTFHANAPLLIACTYLPCLVMVMRRTNEDEGGVRLAASA